MDQAGSQILQPEHWDPRRMGVDRHGHQDRRMDQAGSLILQPEHWDPRRMGVDRHGHQDRRMDQAGSAPGHWCNSKGLLQPRTEVSKSTRRKGTAREVTGRIVKESTAERKIRRTTWHSRSRRKEPIKKKKTKPAAPMPTMTGKHMLVII